MKSDTRNLLNPLRLKPPMHEHAEDGLGVWQGRNYWTDLC